MACRLKPHQRMILLQKLIRFYDGGKVRTIQSDNRRIFAMSSAFFPKQELAFDSITIMSCLTASKLRQQLFSNLFFITSGDNGTGNLYKYIPQMSYLQKGKNERQNNRTRTNSRIEFPVYNFFIQSRISGITCFLLSETKDKKGTYSHTKCWKDTKITGIDTESQAAPLILVYTS